MHENEIGTLIVDCAVHLHQDLGPGLLETVYEVTLDETWVPTEFRRGTDEGWHHSNHSWRVMIPSLCLRASVRTKEDRTIGCSGTGKRQGLASLGNVNSPPADPGR
jgi:hypothetical protein